MKKAMSSKGWDRFVKESNEAFKKMTRGQRRVAVAQDVIAQLDVGVFTATAGTYVDTDINVLDLTTKDDLSELFPKARRCEVCAVGSVAVCAIMRLDRRKLDDEDKQRTHLGFNGAQAYEQAQRIFSRDELGDMETVFESWNFDGSLEATNLEEDQPDKGRLKLIMTCVIENNGRRFSSKMFWRWAAKKYPPVKRVVID